jgi:hypothetical protein
MRVPTPHRRRRAPWLRSLNGMKMKMTAAAVRTKLSHDMATLDAWLCAPKVFRIKGKKMP